MTTTLADINRQMRRDYPGEPTAEEVLEAASDDTLLTTFAALTHRIHEADDDTALRALRDAIRAEVLRRMQP